MSNSNDAIDKFFCNIMTELSSNQYYKEKALTEMTQYIQTLNVNILNRSFCEKFMNNLFPSIYAILYDTPIYQKRIVFEFYLSICLKNFNSIGKESRELMTKILEEHEDLKNGFVKEMRGFIELYPRDDQLKMIRQSGLCNFMILQPYLNPTNVSEFNDVKSLIEKVMVNESERIFDSLIQMLSNSLIKKSVLQFISSKISNNSYYMHIVKEKLMKEYKNIYKNVLDSFDDIPFLTQLGECTVEKINEILSVENIEKNKNTSTYIPIERKSPLFEMIKEKLENEIAAFLSEGELKGSLVFYAKTIFYAIEKWNREKKDYSGMEGIDLQAMILEMVKLLVEMECKQQQIELLKECLKSIVMYINYIPEESLEYIGELWELLIQSIAMPYKDCIISSFKELLSTQNEELLEFEIIAFAERLTEENITVFDNINGIDLVIILAERSAKLQKDGERYINIQSLNDIESLETIRSIMSQLKSTVAQDKCEQFIKSIMLSAPKQEAFTIVMNWIREKNDLFNMKILYGILKNTENCHFKQQQNSYEYTILFEGKEYKIKGDRTTTIDQLMKQVDGCTEMHGIETLLTQQPILRSATLGQLGIPLTEILEVHQSKLKEKLSQRKAKNENIQKPVEEIKEEDIQQIMEFCGVKRDLAMKALQIHHSKEKAISELLESEGRNKIEIELAKDMSKIPQISLDNINSIAEGLKNIFIPNPLSMSNQLNKSFGDGMVVFDGDFITWIVNNEEIEYLFELCNSDDAAIKQIAWLILMRLPTLQNVLRDVDLLKDGMTVEKNGCQYLYFLQTLLKEEQSNVNISRFVCNAICTHDDIEIIQLASSIYGKYCTDMMKNSNLQPIECHYECIKKCIQCVEKHAAHKDSLNILQNTLKMVNVMEQSNELIDGKQLYKVLLNIIKANKENVEVQYIIPKISELIIETIVKNNTFDYFLNETMKSLEEMNTSNQLHENVISQYYLILCEIAKVIMNLSPEKYASNIQQLINVIKFVIQNTKETFSTKEIRLSYCIKLIEILYKEIPLPIIQEIGMMLITKYIEDHSIVNYSSRHAVIHLIEYIKVRNQDIFESIGKEIENKHPKEIIPLKEMVFNNEHREGHVGLNNLGTTCYINSVLQQLYNMKDFRNKILEIDCEELEQKAQEKLGKVMESFSQTSNKENISVEEDQTIKNNLIVIDSDREDNNAMSEEETHENVKNSHLDYDNRRMNRFMDEEKNNKNLMGINMKRDKNYSDYDNNISIGMDMGETIPTMDLMKALQESNYGKNKFKSNCQSNYCMNDEEMKYIMKQLPPEERKQFKDTIELERNLKEHNKQKKSKESKKNNDKSNQMRSPAVTVIRELQKLFIEMSIGSKKYYSPVNLIDSIQLHKERYDLKQTQHDASDFMNLLFDCIEDAIGNTKIFDCLNCKFDETITSLDDSVDYVKKREGEGRILYLPLQMNIDQSIESYFREEIFNGNNMIQTDDGKYIVAKKENRFKTTPEYLILQLNRFIISEDYSRTLKINDECDFNEFITLNKYGCQDGYQLIGVVSHNGGANAGHYISFIKNENVWLECNDSMVTPVSFNRVKETCIGGENKFTGYLFIYSKIHIIQNELKEIKEMDEENQLNESTEEKLRESILEETNETFKKMINNDVELLKTSIGSDMNLFVYRYIENILSSQREDLLSIVDPLLIELDNNGNGLRANDYINELNLTKCLIENKSDKIRMRTFMLCKLLIQYSTEDNIQLFTNKLVEEMRKTREHIDCLKQYFDILIVCFKTSQTIKKMFIEQQMIKKLIDYIKGKGEVNIYNEEYLPDLISLIKLMMKIVKELSQNQSISKETMKTSVQYLEEALLDDDVNLRFLEQSIHYSTKLVIFVSQNNYSYSLKLTKKMKKEITNMKNSIKQNPQEEINQSIFQSLETFLCMDDMYNLFRCYMLLNNINDVTESPHVPKSMNDMNNGILTDIAENTRVNSLIITNVLKLTQHQRNENVKEVLFEMNRVLEDMLIHLLRKVLDNHQQYQNEFKSIFTANYPFLELNSLLEKDENLRKLFTSSDVGLYGDINMVMKLYEERCKYLEKVTDDEEIMSNLIELKQNNSLDNNKK